MAEPWKERWQSDCGEVTLYLGDAVAIMPHLQAVDAIITDPVWPNAHPDLAGAQDPWGLWRRASAVLPDTRVLCVWLGCQSDPRFLGPVPAGLPFLRMCYLRRAVPSYNGRCLVTGDVLYAFGEWPAYRDGRMVLPGECSVTSKPGLRQPHPCARNEEHALWVVKWWSDEGGTVLDCFLGTGTTGVACVALGRRFIGIETDPEHFETARSRIQAELSRFPLFEPNPAAQGQLFAAEVEATQAPGSTT